MTISSVFVLKITARRLSRILHYHCVLVKICCISIYVLCNVYVVCNGHLRCISCYEIQRQTCHLITLIQTHTNVYIIFTHSSQVIFVNFESFSSATTNKCIFLPIYQWLLVSLPKYTGKVCRMILSKLRNSRGGIEPASLDRQAGALTTRPPFLTLDHRSPH